MTGDPVSAGTQPGENSTNEPLDRPAPAAATGAGTDSGPVRAQNGRISLHGISAYGYHGVFDFERARASRFVADVVCWVDLQSAADTDDLSKTLDYGTLATAIVADIEGEPLDLIEALAGRIGRSCLASPLVQQAQVTVHKPEAPIRFAGRTGAAVADVAVTLMFSAARGPAGQQIPVQPDTADRRSPADSRASLRLKEHQE